MLHGFLLHIDKPLIHGYPTAWRTVFHIIILIVTWMLDTHLRFTYHWYTCMHGFSILIIWILVPITCIIVPYYRLHVIWLFPVLDMDLPVTGHERCWYAICGLPHLLFMFPVILFPLYCSRFRYIVLCYQQSSGPVIMLPVSCTVVILVTLYTWRIRS